MTNLFKKKMSSAVSKNGVGEAAELTNGEKMFWSLRVILCSAPKFDRRAR